MDKILLVVASLALIHYLYTGIASKNAKMIRVLKNYDVNKIKSIPSLQLISGKYLVLCQTQK